MKTGHQCPECSRTLWPGDTCPCAADDDDTVELTSRGWSVVADEYQQRERRLYAVLGHRAHGKTLEKAVAELLEENRLLYRWNTELREQTPRSVTPAAPLPLNLDSAWTKGT